MYEDNAELEEVEVIKKKFYDELIKVDKGKT